MPNPVVRRLVVEVYAPEPVRRGAGKPHGETERLRGRDPARAFAWLAVIGLHAAVLAWLWMSPAAGVQRAADPLVLLELIPASTASTAPEAIHVPPAELAPVDPPAATAPRWVRVAEEPAEIAVSVSASSDVMIRDASRAEVQRAFDGCAEDRTQSATAIDRGAEFTLLVRVEKDGRVSDSRVEAGSGAQRIDAAAQHCLLAYGVLSPHRVNGAPIPSWQRVHWSRQGALGVARE